MKNGSMENPQLKPGVVVLTGFKDISDKEATSYLGPQTPNFGGFECCPPQEWGARGAFYRYSLFEKTPKEATLSRNVLD
jgi:hypothetical protein